MDVVRRNIEALRGEIELESVEGAGTTTRLRLPLTLAIIDGFQFLVGKSSYVVPLDMVKECADLVESDLHGGIVRLRGESLPVVHLRKLFSVTDPPSRRRSLVVAQYGSQRVGLLVDQLAGELQAVIKPLGPMFRDLRAVGGTTILGNGSVALILDIPRLAQIATESSASLDAGRTCSVPNN
jgi:two-component system chemotaxis sensor kinase CheA